MFCADMWGEVGKSGGKIKQTLMSGYQVNCDNKIKVKIYIKIMLSLPLNWVATLLHYDIIKAKTIQAK